MNPKQGGVLTSSRRKDYLRRSRRLPFSFGGECAPRKRFDTPRRHLFAFPRRVPRCTTAATLTSSSPIPPDDVLFLLSYSSKNQRRRGRRRRRAARILRFRVLCSSFHHFAFFSVFSVFSVGGRTKGGLGLYDLGFIRKLHFFLVENFSPQLRVHHSNALLRHELDTHKRTKHAGRKPPNGGEQRPGRRSSRVTSDTNRHQRCGFFRGEE